MPELKIIKQMPFSKQVKVVCGTCNGDKTIFENNQVIECPMCLGNGNLIRETIGTMKLYAIKQSKINDYETI